MKKFTITPPSWLQHPPLQKLMGIFDKAEIPYRFVGGCVRETLAKRPIGDIDLASPLSPEAITVALKKHPVKVIPTGIKHGTLTLVVDHHPFELTTLRQDVDHDGRWAKVVYTDDWALDAERRDFTVNAFSMLDNVVYDYVGGLADLKAHRVRFIGDPIERIHEDYLRILRYFRFMADYQGAVHRASLKACLELKDGLATLSGERIHAELLRIMDKKYPQKVVRQMMKHKLLASCFNEVKQKFNPDFFEAVLHQETGTLFKGKGKRPLRRLFAFLNPQDKSSCMKIAERLKLSNEEKHLFVTWQKAIVDFSATSDDHLFYQFLDQQGAEAIWDMLMLVMAAAPVSLPQLKAWVKLANSGVAEHFPVKAADFVGVTGPELGRQLKQARARWVESGFTMGKGELLK